MKKQSNIGVGATASGLVSKQPEKSWSQGSIKKRPSISRIPSCLTAKPANSLQIRARSALGRKLSLSHLSNSASGASVGSHTGENGAHRNSRGDTADAGHRVIIDRRAEGRTPKYIKATEIKDSGELSSVPPNSFQREIDPALEEDKKQELESKVSTSPPKIEEHALALANDSSSGQSSPRVERLDLRQLDNDDSNTEVETEQGEDESPSRTSDVSDHQDKRILAELQVADQQASQTVKKVEELKKRICEIQNKECLSEKDNSELQAINEQLKTELQKLEKITRNVQRLVGIADMFSFREGLAYDLELTSDRSVEDEVISAKKHQNTARSTESTGSQEKKQVKSKSNSPSLILEQKISERDVTNINNFPKLNPLKKTPPDLRANKEIYVEDMLPRVIICGPNQRQEEDVSKVPVFTRQLRESYSMQERLAADNVDLEGEKYRLQEELLKKDQLCDALQRKLTALENEMRLVSKDNAELSEKLLQYTKPNVLTSDGECDDGIICEAEVEASIVPVLKQCRAEASALEDRLAGTTNEMSCLRAEFEQVRKERCQLDSLIRATAAVDPNSGTVCDKCAPSCDAHNVELNELRARHTALQHEFESRSLEVQLLTRNCEQLSAALRNERSGYVRDMEALRGIEEKLLDDKAGQKAEVLEKQFQEATEELEELRATNKDLTMQLENYRNKYLTAQQALEEERRQVDLLQQDNARANEQVNLEVQRVKETFQERLRKLSPLPYLLEESKLKLQEALSQKQASEKAAESIATEFRAFQERARAVADEARRARSSHQQLSAQQMSEQAAAEALRVQNASLVEEVSALRAAAEQTAMNEHRLEEHLQESRALVQRMEQMHQTSTHQMTRYRERSDNAKRAAQARIAELETSLAQARAAASCAAKEHEELRRGLQAKVDALRYDYEDAILRINGMQGHVQYLQGISGTENLVVPAKIPPPAVHLAEHFVSGNNDMMAVMAPTANQDGDRAHIP